MPGKNMESEISQVVKCYKKFNSGWQMKPGERKMVIEYLLCGITADQICDAITGLFLSPHHQGKNKTGSKFLEFHYVFREHNFDKFRALAEEDSRSEAARRRKVKEDQRRTEQQEQDRNSMLKKTSSGYSCTEEYRRNMGKKPT